MSDSKHRAAKGTALATAAALLFRADEYYHVTHDLPDAAKYFADKAVYAYHNAGKGFPLPPPPDGGDRAIIASSGGSNVGTYTSTVSLFFNGTNSGVTGGPSVSLDGDGTIKVVS